mmetsp:Transcript_117207/g.184361  ORF Transcript_117207/g.184361 Transcript_117207/m.184361 type:complete len:434 (-) Transcript_117207:184-1485(-)
MQSPRTDIDLEPVRTIVIKRHAATDSSQLDLYVNDIVFVLEKDETGWWGGHKDGEDLTGWFPGFCVQALPEEKAPCIVGVGSDSMKTRAEAKEEEAPRNAALETQVSSPAYGHHAVASPQRHGLFAGGAGGAHAMRESRNSEVLLKEKTRQCSLLDDEVAKLKRDKESLEEALRQAQKQNNLEKENAARMVGRVSEVEQKLQAETRERRNTVLKCEQLEAELRHRDEEVATLRRLSVVSAMTPNAASFAQSPVQQTNDEGARRRLFSSIANGTSSTSHTSEVKSNSIAANPPSDPAPAPAVSNGNPAGGCSASARTSSRSRGRRSDEEPPIGFVKQLKSAFEARSVTPQRPQSRGRATTENFVRPGAWGISVTAAATTGAKDGASAPFAKIALATPGPAISAEPAPEEIVYGMSPINSHSSKDKSATKAGRSK